MDAGSNSSNNGAKPGGEAALSEVFCFRTYGCAHNYYALSGCGQAASRPAGFLPVQHLISRRSPQLRFYERIGVVLVRLSERSMQNGRKFKRTGDGAAVGAA